MEKISNHVYWLPPAPPDRPSLCAVEGERATIWLDAGSSAAHTREFLDALAAEGAAKPTHVVLTHSHWDHVFGADELGAHVVAHELTAGVPPRARGNRLERRRARPPCRGRRELPAARRQRQTGAAVAPRSSHQARRRRVPRRPRLRPRRRAGAVRHVGGDHADDSSVVYIEPDGVLFLGDCLYEAPSGGYTVERATPLLAAVRSFGRSALRRGPQRDRAFAGRARRGDRRSTATTATGALGGAEGVELAVESESLEGVGLDLPHALARQAEGLADLLQRLRGSDRRRARSEA